MVTDPPAGIGFMGREWDKDKGGREQWIDWLAAIMVEARRVLKPGSHALVWALPRTSHWTALALERAGFELRDSLHHVFGTGFPKSLDISKAINREAGAEREVISEYATGWSETLGGRGALGGISAPDVRTKSAPATPEAQRWDGWGTALKPAHEVWWLARVPIEAGSIARQVLETGTGAVNVSGCRVGSEGGTRSGRAKEPSAGAYGDGLNGGGAEPIAAGRWPPNFLLSHSPDCGESCAEGCPVAELDRQSGERKSGSRAAGTFAPVGYQGSQPSPMPAIRGDSGTGSRFFPIFRYSAKPSTAEKSAGLEHRAKLKGGEATGRAEGSAALSSPRTGAGRTGKARNPHPTAKGLDLMAWLVRLVTPPEGVVLDPFLGSGTTGCAAVREGMSFVGCDLSPEYVEVSRDRIREWLGPLLWNTVDRRGDANGPADTSDAR
ncbi:MAG: site-specific DNA-methyltransferase [bacterium]|nr:site-specific DNA-methyltransferase [bacterium]